MGSSRLAEARPVRKPPSSVLSSVRAPCMRRLSSLMSWVGAAMAGLLLTAPVTAGSGYGPPPAPRSAPTFDQSLATSTACDGGRAPLAAQNLGDRLRFPDREHDDRHMVFPGKREGRGV